MPEEVPELDELEAIEDDGLDQLEELEELDELEAADEDDGPFELTVAAAGDEAFDTRVTITVPPDMDKKAVPAALTGPLERLGARERARLRHRRTVVEFLGDALIGSATKDMVGKVLGGLRPTRLVVRRGYGDEVVAENEAPRAEVAVRDLGERLELRVGGGLDSAEIVPMLLEQWPSTGAHVRGKRLEITFVDARPDAAGRGAIEAFAREQDATALTVDGELRFDRGLEALVRTTTSNHDLRVTVDDRDPARAKVALALALRALSLDGKSLTVECGSGDDEALRTTAIELGKAARAMRVVTTSGELLWPRLVEPVPRDGELLLCIVPHGRDAAAITRAFARELPRLAGQLGKAKVALDWPEGFVLDDALADALIQGALVAHKPARVVSGVLGQEREVFHPDPLPILLDGGRATIVVDTDIAKPAELVRGIERALRRRGSALREKSVRVELRGGTMPSRSMVRALVEGIRGAGAHALDLVSDGRTDRIFPALLSIESTKNSTRLRIDRAGRSDDQVGWALERELGAVPAEALRGVTLASVDPDLETVIVNALVQRGAMQVLREDGAGGVAQIHPAPEPEPEPTPEPAAEELAELEPVLDDVAEPAPVVSATVRSTPTPTVEPARTAPLTTAEPIRILGRRSSATPPVVLMEIDLAAGSDLEALTADLAATDLDGCLALVVLSAAGRTRSAVAGHPTTMALQSALTSRTAALAWFRGRDGAGRPYFQVVASNHHSHAVGSCVRDPRG